MKKLHISFLSSLFVVLFVLFHPKIGRAQNNRIGDFLKAGKQDAEILTKAYLKPLPGGLGGNLNTGWFNTASTHRPLGFDIQIRGALAFVPSSDRSFDLNDLDLQKVRPGNANATISPTAAGDNTTGPEVVVRDQGKEVADFKLPQGSGFHAVPTPMVQLTAGLIKHTDLIIHYIPKVKIGDYGKLALQGIGIKHELNQWLPGGKLFPLTISLAAGYNHINLNSNLNLKPQPDAETDPAINYDNQKVETTINTFTAKLIVGKDLPFISIYAAAGYEVSTLNIDLTGNYPVPITGPNGKTRTETLADPFSYSQNGDNTFSLKGGIKFKLFFFHIFGDYTLAKYPVANAGIGFSFR